MEKSKEKKSFGFKPPSFLVRGKKSELESEETQEAATEVEEAAETAPEVDSRNSSDGDNGQVVASLSDITKEPTKESPVRKKEFFGFLGRGRTSERAISDEPRNLSVQESASGYESEESESEKCANEGNAKAEVGNAQKTSLDFMVNNFLKLVKGETQKKEQEQTISDIVAGVRDQIEQGDTEESSSLSEIIKVVGEYKEKLGEVATKYVGSINLSKLSPTAVMYYLEREDEVKNPSWKRRQHRFSPNIKIEKVHELNDALILAYLCYADTVDEIRDGLDKYKTPYDLVYVNMRSSPGQPANFVAVKRDQSSSHRMKKISPNLYVIIGVRGTKTAADAITDLLCDTVEYKGGRAHSFILESGKYVADKHRGLLEELRVKSGKAKVKVTLVGHSLGAGAASIAGMELYNTSPKLEVKVIGFGCPALVSSDLAEKATYITTVVNDTDIVPRLSGITVANLLLDIMAFNWMPYAQRDIQYTLEELQKRHSRIFKETTAKKVTQTVEPLLEKHLKGTLLKDRAARFEPEVFPPGKCIHFYRDGSGVSGSYVPNTFFSEIDVTRRMIDGTLHP
jgi:pimeloyl-ACP methyl ester carboxylesterase